MKENKSISRRGFLKGAAAMGAVAGAPMIIPASALGADGNVAPSNRINMGFIGTGNQGTSDMEQFLQDERIQVVAVCDVNRESPGYWDGAVAGREPARRLVEEHYSGNTASGRYKGCDTHVDFRELLARDDIDAVEVATPDHWHAIPVIAACKAGKDIYCQKPLALTVKEGRAMANAVKKYGRIFQTGSQQRSDFNFRRACELALNGRLGKVHAVTCGLPGGTPDFGGTAHKTKPEPVPAGFEYDFWLGPAPRAPYCEGRCHVNFRWIFDYSGGQITDWGGHHPDIAQWGMGTERTGPELITNTKATFADHDLYETATKYYYECMYKNGTKLIIADSVRGGVTFEGTEGWAWADRGRHDASPKSLLNTVIGPDEMHLYVSRDHYRNFIDCVISRREPIAPAEVAQRSITLSHLGNISIMLGRDLKWDPDKEEFIGDREANGLLGRAYREPWVL